jgi:hypothetical protein
MALAKPISLHHVLELQHRHRGRSVAVQFYLHFSMTVDAAVRVGFLTVTAELYQPGRKHSHSRSRNKSWQIQIAFVNWLATAADTKLISRVIYTKCAKVSHQPLTVAASTGSHGSKECSVQQNQKIQY